jgi:hypothetical protein
VFDDLQQVYTAIELDNRDDGATIQTILEQMTGARTVSILFKNATVCLFIVANVYLYDCPVWAVMVDSTSLVVTAVRLTPQPHGYC